MATPNAPNARHSALNDGVNATEPQAPRPRVRQLPVRAWHQEDAETHHRVARARIADKLRAMYPVLETADLTGQNATRNANASIVQRLEWMLFNAAHSRREYANKCTLPRRVQALVTQQLDTTTAAATASTNSEEKQANNVTRACSNTNKNKRARRSSIASVDEALSSVESTARRTYKRQRQDQSLQVTSPIVKGASMEPSWTATNAETSIVILNNDVNLIAQVFAFLEGSEVLRARAVSRFLAAHAPGIVHSLTLDAHKWTTSCSSHTSISGLLLKCRQLRRLVITNSRNNQSTTGALELPRGYGIPVPRNNRSSSRHVDQQVLPKVHGQDILSQVTLALNKNACPALETLELRAPFEFATESGTILVCVQTLLQRSLLNHGRSQLKRLILDSTFLGDARMQQLAGALRSNCFRDLETLVLRNNFIGEAGCQALFGSLHACPVLQELDVSGNILTDTDMFALATAMDKTRRPRTFRPQEEEAVALVPFSQLHTLRLHENFIGLDGFHALASAICAQLLDLNGNEMDARGGDKQDGKSLINNSGGSMDAEERRALEEKLAAALAELSDDEHDSIQEDDGNGGVQRSNYAVQEYVRLDLDQVLRQVAAETANVSFVPVADEEKNDEEPTSWHLLLATVAKCDSECFQAFQCELYDVHTTILSSLTSQQMRSCDMNAEMETRSNEASGDQNASEVLPSPPPPLAAAKSIEGGRAGTEDRIQESIGDVSSKEAPSLLLEPPQREKDALSAATAKSTLHDPSATATTTWKEDIVAAITGSAVREHANEVELTTPDQHEPATSLDNSPSPVWAQREHEAQEHANKQREANELRMMQLEELTMRKWMMVVAQIQERSYMAREELSQRRVMAQVRALEDERRRQYERDAMVQEDTFSRAWILALQQIVMRDRLEMEQEDYFACEWRAQERREQDRDRLAMAQEEELARRVQLQEVQLQNRRRQQRREACSRVLLWCKKRSLGFAFRHWRQVVELRRDAACCIQRAYRHYLSHQSKHDDVTNEVLNSPGSAYDSTEAAAAAMVVQSTFRGFSIRRKFANALEVANLVRRSGDYDDVEFGEINLDDLIQMPPELEDGWEDPVLPAPRPSHHYHGGLQQHPEVSNQGNETVDELDEDARSPYECQQQAAMPSAVRNFAQPAPTNLAASLWDKMRKLKQRQRHAADERVREQDPTYRLQKLMHKGSSKPRAPPVKASNNNPVPSAAGGGGRNMSSSASTVVWGTSGEKKKPKVKLPSLVERLRKKTEAAR
ncbi:Leucine-rich repeat, ribonuclease inhibitor subtype, partial [Globisporangium splendens]